MRRILIALLLAVSPLWAQGELDRLLDELEASPPAERVAAFNAVAVELRGNDPGGSIDYATQARSLAAELGDTEGEVRALNNIGIGHYFLAEYDRALEFYNSSLKLAEESEFEAGIADALNNTGVLYFVWGDYDQALEYYSRVVELRKSSDDQAGLAKAYNNLGNVYYEAGRYDESLDYYERSISFHEENGEESYVASSLNNVGLIHIDLEQYDLARNRFDRALEISERIDDKADLGLSLHNIGLVNAKTGQFREALEFYRRSLAVREELGDRQGVTICLQNIGLTQVELGNARAARQYLERALEMSQELQVKEIEREVHLGLSRAHALDGGFEQALDSYKRYKSVNDELFDETTDRRLSELQTRYEVERKDREIDNLRQGQQIQRLVRNGALIGSFLLLVVIGLLVYGYRQKDRANQEIRRTNEALEQAQAERAAAARAELAHVSRVATMGTLATSLAHELNQPLTAILSNAQATRRMIAGGAVEPAELDAALADIVDGSRRSRDLIKRLRELVRRGDIKSEPLNVNDAVRDVSVFARVEAEKKGASLSLDLEPGLPQVSGDRIQLQQVVFNLVQNAADAMIAVAEEQRNVDVRTESSEDRSIRVTVSDRGPAIAAEVAERMFDPFFTTKSEGLGMGLAICSGIVEAHGGRIVATPRSGGGLTVAFTLPPRPA